MDPTILPLDPAFDRKDGSTWWNGRLKTRNLKEKANDRDVESGAADDDDENESN